MQEGASVAVVLLSLMCGSVVTAVVYYDMGGRVPFVGTTCAVCDDLSCESTIYQPHRRRIYNHTGLPSLLGIRRGEPRPTGTLASQKVDSWQVGLLRSSVMQLGREGIRWTG